MATNTVKKRPIIYRLVMKDGAVWEVTKPWLHPEGDHAGERVDTLVTGIFRFDEVPRHVQTGDAGEILDFQPGRAEHFLIFGLPLKPIECTPEDPEAMRIFTTPEGQVKIVQPDTAERKALPIYVDAKGVARKMGPFGKTNEGSIAEIDPENVERVEFAQSYAILQRECERLVAEENGAEPPAEPAKQRSAAAGTDTTTDKKAETNGLPRFG